MSARAPRVLVVGLDDLERNPGGLNRYVAGLIKALNAIGVRTALLTAGSGELSSRVLPVKLVRLWLESRKIAGQFDVVDAHFALHVLPLWTSSRWRRTPLVVHFHGPWAAESAAQGENRHTVAAKRAVERYVYRRATVVIVLSRAFGQILVDEYRVAPWKVHVIPPGVDLDKFQPEDRHGARVRLGLDLPSGSFVAGTVRRLVPRMGHTVLLEAWSTIARHQGHEVRDLLVIAGDGPEREALQTLAKKLGIDGSVRFLGIVADSALADLYNAADVTVVPSVRLEGFGLVALESLACGTPVIASRTGGLPDALERFDPEVLVPPADAGALARAIDTIRSAESPESRDDCRRYAQGFTWTATAAAHVPLFEQAGSRSSTREAPLSVVCLDHTARLSGGEIALTRLLPALGPAFDTHVVLAEDGPLTGRLRASDISVEVLRLDPSAGDFARQNVRPAAVSPRAALATASYIVRLAARLRALRPDLVHTNSLKALVYGTIAAKLARVPVVVYVHDRLAPDYLPRPAVRAVRLICRYLADGIVANSEATLATVGEVRGASTIVAPPVAISQVSRQVRPANADRFVVACVGRLAPWKGQELFLQSFAAAFGGGSERALIIGAPLFGENEYESHLYWLAEQLGVEHQVQFTGFRDDVDSLLADADVLVHTSIIPEPYGQVVVEAMAIGLCVIASGEGGPASLITDGVDGLLCEPRNRESFAAALRRVRRDERLRRTLGANAARTAEAFAPEIAGPKLGEFYRSVIRATSPA